MILIVKYFWLIDIDECFVDDGGCSDICINDDGLYFCFCGVGYELYVYFDFNNISLVDGEMGIRVGDKIRINYICVSKWLYIILLIFIILYI